MTSRERKPADVQKLPLTAAEIRDILRLTLANMVEPISINTDRKCFYQLKESEVLKTERGLSRKKETKKPTQQKNLTNKKTPKTAKTPHKQKGEGSGFCTFFLFMLNIYKPQPLGAVVDCLPVNVIRETGRMETESRAAICELRPTQAGCKF